VRRLALLAALAMLAAPALAQQPTPAPKAAARVAVPALPPRSSLPNSAADAAGAQCSAQCSRTYYACLAGENPQFCSGDWAQCRVSCGNAARRSAGPGLFPGR
jgi:hypothetical protein